MDSVTKLLMLCEGSGIFLERGLFSLRNTWHCLRIFYGIGEDVGNNQYNINQPTRKGSSENGMLVAATLDGVLFFSGINISGYVSLAHEVPCVG